MTLARALSLALAAAAGALSVFAFAPFGWSGLIFVTFGVLAWRWQRATSAREAAGDGFAFGAGLFGAGSSWLTVALVNFGGMPIGVAAIAIAILTAYLALWPALAGGIAVRFTPANSVYRLVAAAGAFTATEWIRSYLFTGFPWLALGYTQVPDGIVRGYAPIGGVYLVTLAVALGAGLVAFFVDALAERRRGRIVTSTAAAIVIAAASGTLVHVDWTRPAGEPVSVSLLQGNVVQQLKFDPAFRTTTYERYLSLVRQSRGRLIVLPESAFPVFSGEVPDQVLLSLIRTAGASVGTASSRSPPTRTRPARWPARSPTPPSCSVRSRARRPTRTIQPPRAARRRRGVTIPDSSIPPGSKARGSAFRARSTTSARRRGARGRAAV